MLERHSTPDDSPQGWHIIDTYGIQCESPPALPAVPGGFSVIRVQENFIAGMSLQADCYAPDRRQFLNPCFGTSLLSLARLPTKSVKYINISNDILAMFY